MQKTKKNSKLTYNETTKDWVYKFGAKGKKKINEKLDIIREVSPSIFENILTR